MTLPRTKLIDPKFPGCYHLYSRCVRRAWLCGKDPLSGRSYEHRRRWLEDRVLFLCQRFAVELYGYAMMDNHYHLIVRVEPQAPRAWDDAEVAKRWLDLFPPRDGVDFDARWELRFAALMADSRKLDECRERLGSLSWLMRLLNEPIARRANREDECTGRFWEGRFKSQALLDDPAQIAATVYVDLNPVRAKMASDPLAGPNTSISRRLGAIVVKEPQTSGLPPLARGLDRKDAGLPIGITEYCELLRWSARTATADWNSQAASPPLAIHRLGGLDQWSERLQALRRRDCRAFGNLAALRAYAHRTGRRWIRGTGDARAPPASA